MSNVLNTGVCKAMIYWHIHLDNKYRGTVQDLHCLETDFSAFFKKLYRQGMFGNHPLNLHDFDLEIKGLLALICIYVQTRS